MSNGMLFTNARIVDPAQNMDETGSLTVLSLPVARNSQRSTSTKM